MDNPFAEIDSKIRRFIDRSLRGEQSKADFNELALELFILQYQFNPAYARLCGVRPGVVTDWRQVPATPAVAFKETDLTALPPGERSHIFLSSGTTVKDRSRHFHNATSLSLYGKSLVDGYRLRFGAFARRHDIFCLVPSADRAPNSSLAHMFERLVHVTVPFWQHRHPGFVDPAGAWQIEIPAVIELLPDYQAQNIPILFLGTAFQFAHLLDALADRNLTVKLPVGSGVLETGGYKGRSREISREELRRLIEERLGIPPQDVFSEYGMSELSSQAYDQADGIFRFPPWARAVLISPATGREVGEGERGLLRVYDLANVYSVMPIQTEDIGIKVGDGFKLVGRAAQAEARGCSLMSA